MSLIDKLKSKFNEMFPDESDPPISDKITVIMPNGTKEEFPADKDFYGDDCVVESVTYHTHCYCDAMKSAHQMNLTIKFMSIGDAEQKGFHYCHQCEQWDKSREAEE